jgi:hypothetical protein
MFPQVLIGSTIGALHAIAFVRPLSGAPFVVTRTYARQSGEADVARLIPAGVLRAGVIAPARI